MAPEGPEPWTGLRLILDPGHGGLDPGHQAEGIGSEAAWTLAVAQACAQRCLARGAQVILTRAADVLVPTALRGMYAACARADLAVSLHLGPAVGGPGPLLRWGTPWTQWLRGRPLVRQLQRALARRLPAARLRGGPRPCWGRCCVLPVPPPTLRLLVVVHPTERPGPGAWPDPAQWGALLAGVLLTGELQAPLPLHGAWPEEGRVAPLVLPPPAAPGRPDSGADRPAPRPAGETPPAENGGSAAPPIPLVPGVRQPLVGPLALRQGPAARRPPRGG